MLALTPAKPSLLDHSDRGHISSSVIVATERRDGLDAARKEASIVLVLDCRHMLLGLRWQRVVGPLVSFQRLADHFYDECPAGYSVTLTGAVVRNTEDGPMLEVSNGQVVTVGFEDALFSEEDHDEPGDDDVDGSADRNRLSPSDTTNDQAAGDTVPAVRPLGRGP